MTLEMSTVCRFFFITLKAFFRQCHRGVVSRGQKLVTVVKERPLTLLHYLLLYTTSSLQRSIFQGECLLQIVPRKMALVHQSKCKLNFLSSSGLPACPYVHTTQLSTISEKVQWSLLPLFPSSPHSVEIISEKAFLSL